MYPELQHLRKDLHQHPELSGAEKETARRIVAFILEHHPPTELITEIGGHGLAFVQNIQQKGGQSLLLNNVLCILRPRPKNKSEKY